MKKHISKMKDKWGKLNKKNVVIGLLGIVILVILIAVISGLDNKKTLTCTKKETVIDFKFDEKVVMKLENDQITLINLDKSVTIGDEYNKFDTYHNIIENLFNNSYDYLSKSDYEIKQKNNTTSVKLEVSKKHSGVILDNMQIISNNPDNKYDLTFNRINNLDGSSSTYKIGDKYKYKDLKIKIEGLGYTCK